MSPPEEGRRAVKLFSSVGADLFGLTFKHDSSGETEYLTMHADLLKERMTEYIGRGERKGLSFIVRPVADHLIQNDDLNADSLEQWKPFIFRADETSPGRYQGWLALPLGTDAATRKKIRDRINTKAGNSIDSGATGAGRFPGSLNQKEIRRQPDGTFPRVTTVYSNPGRFVTIEELEAAGQLAPEPPPTPKPKATKPTINLNSPTVWPDYNLELQWVDRKENGEPDRSKADINFCIRARKWRWSEGEIAARLYEVSDKAKRRKFDYAQATARRAVEIVESGGGR
jgi:hypothetical protein